MELGNTARGFSIAEFTDRYGLTCSMQASSLATEDCIWLGVDDAQPIIMASQAKEHGVETDAQVGWVEYPVPKEVLMHTHMHLTQGMVKELLPHLIRFAETGEL